MMMMNIIDKTLCTDYVAYLTATNDTTSFRTLLYPEYKANRKSLVRPVHYQAVRDYLIETWKAEVVSEIEADDMVCQKQHEMYQGNYSGVSSTEFKMSSYYAPAVLVGIDKDLDQQPGLHYNYTKDSWYYVTEIEGLRNLYSQMLTGDRSDNIPRVKKGWKEKEALAKINVAKTEEELYDIVLMEHVKYYETDKFNNAFVYTFQDRIQWLGDLLYLRRSPEDRYKLPLEVLDGKQ